MKNSVIKISIGLLTLLMFSACAVQEGAVLESDASMQCPSDQTLTCDEFAGEQHNCSCERGGNLRDLLDAYQTPNY